MRARVVALGIVVSILVASLQASAVAPHGVKNVIVLIGDGMGFSQLELTKLVYGHLNMEDMPYTGFELTDSLSGEVTDPAAAGTAIATGFKTYNGMISTLKYDGKIVNLTTLLELSQFAGKSTGLVTTTRITHATPAVFASHVEDRDMEKAIARQLIQHKVNVLFGGGKEYFNDEILNFAKSYGYKVVFDREGLENVNGEYVLGLFANSHIPYVLDRDANTPGLLKMTEKAIELLEKNPNGFFLMVEGGRIDHACHANDVASTVAETKEFDDVVGYVLKYAMERGDTLVIVTADHETGGLAVSINYGDSINESKILGIKRSTSFMANEIKNGKDIREVVKKYAGIELTNEDVEKIEKKAKENPKYGLINALGEVISEKVGVRFASHKHTGVIVPLIAYGPGAEDFRGFMHHVNMSKRVAKLMLFGQFEPSQSEVKIQESSIKGDLNGDMKVDYIDAYITLTRFVGDKVDSVLEKRVDMDNNGIVDFKDVALIMQ